MRKIALICLLLTASIRPLVSQNNILADYNRTRFAGTFHYRYPYNTPRLNEDRYVRLTATDGRNSGWLYATSDEFDIAREGYRPGFFVVEMRDVTIDADTLRFNIVVGGGDCFARPVPLTVRSSEEGRGERLAKWEQADKWEERTIEYRLVLDNSGESLRLFNLGKQERKTPNFLREQLK